MIKNKRIGNLEFREAVYFLPNENLPEHISYHIDYWYPNSYYGHENDYDKNGDDWYCVKGNPHCRIHKDCFKNPQSCFSIASFNYQKNEGFYELHFIGDRPLNITKEERDIFWKLVQYGNKVLNSSQENEIDDLNVYNGHSYVDLGLPSGTLWATMNVGANSETDYGLYFSWGETKGYADVCSDKTFDWKDYKYISSDSILTKYNVDDDIKELDIEDDAARENMGGEWSIPTIKQVAELLDTNNCTNEWIINYNGSGVNGRLFTSTNNGKTLFFPAAGTCCVSKQGVNDILNICISTLSEDFYTHSECLHSSKEDVLLIPTSRCFGISVRGVINY